MFAADADALDSACAWYLPAGARWQLREIESGSSLGVEETTTAILDQKALEETLARDWARTAFAHLGVELATVERHGRPGRQVLTPVNAIDLLGYHPQRKEWWVIELKHGRRPMRWSGRRARTWAGYRRSARGEGRRPPGPSSRGMRATTTGAFRT
jgi:hypothetical protein